MSTTTTAQDHLEWCAQRALEYYDHGDKANAIASFVSDVRKHDGTGHIASLLAGGMIMLLESSYDRGREPFKKFMLDFAVSG